MISFVLALSGFLSADGIHSKDENPATTRIFHQSSREYWGVIDAAENIPKFYMYMNLTMPLGIASIVRARVAP